MEQKPISHLTAGLVLGGILVILYILASQLTGFASASQWLTYIVVFGGLIFFINRYGRALNNNVTFGKLFAYGFKITAILTLIMIAFVVIYNLAFPELREKSFEMISEEMGKNKNLRDEDIETGIAFTKKYFWPITIGSALLGHIIMGALGSLLGAALTKKQPRPAVDQLDF